MKNPNFLKSVKHALEGIAGAFLTERNLRFHFAIANLICIFAFYYGLDKNAWAVLILTIIAVISAELFNTAVEAAVDTATKEFSVSAKFAKDVSAGAVLVAAAGAVTVGIFLFGDTGRIAETLRFIFTDIRRLFTCILFFAADMLILFGVKKSG